MHDPPHNRTGGRCSCAAARQMLLTRLPAEQLIAARAPSAGWSTSGKEADG